jgi:sorbitol/mannitol transport system permease protein
LEEQPGTIIRAAGVDALPEIGEARDTAVLIQHILTAADYHAPLAALAMRYLKGGMAPAQVVLTLRGLLLAVPAAYAMAFFPTRRTQKVLLWMLSTKMMPSVGVLVPIYLLWKNSGLLDTVSGLVIVYTLINLPIAVWMSFTYFAEIPRDILEAGRIDGAATWQEIVYLLMPMSLPGLASTALLLVILSWNEAFWSINLSSSNAAPLTVFIASYSSPEGLFWAKLSAASLLAVAPILIVGWLSQKQLVRGLTFGAVK